MREQIRLLIELQRYDARLQESDSSLQAIPRKLDALKADLAKLEAMVAKEREELEGHEKFRSSQQSTLHDEESNVVKAKGKLQQAKTGREHMAAQREIETNRKAAQERQEEIVKLSDAIETGRKRLEAHEKDVADLREVVASEGKVAQERMDEIRNATSGERTARDKAASTIRKDVMRKYDNLRNKRNPVIVPVGPGGICQGCQMRIPPQLFNILHRVESIESCPSCYRLIYLPSLFPESGAPEASGADDASGK